MNSNPLLTFMCMHIAKLQMLNQYFVLYDEFHIYAMGKNELQISKYYNIKGKKSFNY